MRSLADGPAESLLSLSELIRAREAGLESAGVQIGRVIGTGSFGRVYKGACIQSRSPGCSCAAQARRVHQHVGAGGLQG